MAEELTRRELCMALGLSSRQVLNLEKEGMPHRSDGRRKLYTSEAVMWYFGRRRGDPRARKLEAEAQLLEMQVRRERNELVEVEEVHEVVTAGLALLRAHLLAIPGRIGPRMKGPTAEAVEILDPAIRDAMEALSTVKYFRDDPEGAVREAVGLVLDVELPKLEQAERGRLTDSLVAVFCRQSSAD